MKKNNLDERQEQKLLQIEHNGCWMAFWMLLASLFVQQMIFGIGEWKYVAGEWIVFMCLALYLCISCIKIVFLPNGYASLNFKSLKFLPDFFQCFAWPKKPPAAWARPHR